MPKKTDDAPPRAIKITLTDEAPEENTTLLALLRDAVGGQGTLSNRLGRVFQDFMARQVAAAVAKRGAVKGKVTLVFTFATGPDGSHGLTCEVDATPAKVPARPTVVFTDEDGDLLSRPAEPLTEEMYRRAKVAAPEAKNPAEPKAGAASKV